MLRVVHQQCCVRLYGLKSLTGFKLLATSANIVVVPYKRTQHAGPNNVTCLRPFAWPLSPMQMDQTLLANITQQCCDMLRPFAWAFKFQFCLETIYYFLKFNLTIYEFLHFWGMLLICVNFFQTKSFNQFASNPFSTKTLSMKRAGETSNVLGLAKWRCKSMQLIASL